MVLIVGGGFDRAAVPQLAEQLRAMAPDHDQVVVCDVSGVSRPDVAFVDALARLQLAARRLGYSIQLRNASDELQDLLVLAGLREVLPLCARLGRERRRQAEEREVLPVDEVRDPADPTV